MRMCLSMVASEVDGARAARPGAEGWGWNQCPDLNPAFGESKEEPRSSPRFGWKVAISADSGWFFPPVRAQHGPAALNKFGDRRDARAIRSAPSPRSVLPARLGCLRDRRGLTGIDAQAP